jgi:hypothetical protein
MLTRGEDYADHQPFTDQEVSHRTAFFAHGGARPRARVVCLSTRRCSGGSPVAMCGS